jgi:hypothetical protein
VTNYVTLYIPVAAALVGLAVYLRRRSTEGKAARAVADADTTKSEGRAGADGSKGGEGGGRDGGEA